MSEPRKSMCPLQLSLAAVEFRAKAAEELFRAAVVENDIEGMQNQRAALQALLDEKLDVMAGMMTKLMRGDV